MSHCLFVFSIRLMMLRNVPVVRAAEPVFLEVHIEFGEVEGRAQMLMRLIMPGTYCAICISIRSLKLNVISSLAEALYQKWLERNARVFGRSRKYMKRVITECIFFCSLLFALAMFSLRFC